MPLNPVIEPGTEWTSPENRGVCGFCGGEEGGYAKRDSSGKWEPSCWNCVKPIGPVSQPKRKLVGTAITEPEEETDMARTDGRVKCNTKGCKNYVKPPVETCKPCRAANTAQETVVEVPKGTLLVPAHDIEGTVNTSSVEQHSPYWLGAETVLVSAQPVKPVSHGEPLADVKASDVPEAKTRARKPFDTAKAVELYQGGMKVVDIAVALGYDRGQGQNRTRQALRDAGVYKERA